MRLPTFSLALLITLAHHACLTVAQQVSFTSTFSFTANFSDSISLDTSFPTVVPTQAPVAKKIEGTEVSSSSFRTVNLVKSLAGVKNSDTSNDRTSDLNNSDSENEESGESDAKEGTLLTSVPDEVSLLVNSLDPTTNSTEPILLRFKRTNNTSVFTKSAFDTLPKKLLEESTGQVNYESEDGYGALTLSLPRKKSSFSDIRTLLQRPTFYGTRISNKSILQFKTVSQTIAGEQQQLLQVDINPETGSCGGELHPESSEETEVINPNQTRRLLRRFRDMQATEVFPNCYSGQEKLQTLKIGVAVSKTLQQYYGAANVLDKITEYITNANIVYVSQLNIRLVVNAVDLTFDTTTKSDCNTITTVLANFKAHTKQSSQAIWHLMEHCLPYLTYDTSQGITTGVAYIGTLCAATANIGVSYEHGSGTWLTVAHEIGHNFGASHSFENGVGTTGGIMDYGNGKYEGLYQFNPLRKTQLCSTITSVASSNSCPNSFSLNICEDQSPTYIYFTSNPNTDVPCSELTNYCNYASVQQACPKTCNLCQEEAENNVPQPAVSTGPTKKPTKYPTGFPTKYVTEYPTEYPTGFPTSSPSAYPTRFPTMKPTTYPTRFPTVEPTSYPTLYPTSYPTDFPM